MQTEQEEPSVLNLISTADLIEELASRHKELIVIREHKKQIDTDNIFVKTAFGVKGRTDKGFDLIEATQMLNAAHRQLTHDYLDDIEKDGD